LQKLNDEIIHHRLKSIVFVFNENLILQVGRCFALMRNTALIAFAAPMILTAAVIVKDISFESAPLQTKALLQHK
jgi:hypothetical protein